MLRVAFFVSCLVFIVYLGQEATEHRREGRRGPMWVCVGCAVPFAVAFLLLVPGVVRALVRWLAFM